jgi:cytochrome c oxidase cbb3-type subunit 1
MAIKSVNALSHYTDWTIAHVHSGALGWVAMITIGSLYSMAPRVMGLEQMHSVRAINVHFWMHTTGTIMYVVAMWTAGVTEGLMWRATLPSGSLEYSFMDSLRAIHPLYIIRASGGVIIVGGMLLMGWNMWRTWQPARRRGITPVAVPQGA